MLGFIGMVEFVEVWDNGDGIYIVYYILVIDGFYMVVVKYVD